MIRVGLAVLLAACAAVKPVRDRADRPEHHKPDGGFRNPWPTDVRDQRPPGAFLRWQWERLTGDLPPNPPPGSLPLVEPEVAYPRAAPDELRITWVGHASFLLQIGGLNVLTDPHWSHRASPVQWLGPERFVPPGISWEALPTIDAVLLSHDHYDHLDDGTVRRLRERFGDHVRWFVPLGYREWFADRNVRNVTELDWFGEAELSLGDHTLRIVALPSQHWANRNPLVREKRLWASWAVITPSGHRLYFGGDTGYFPGFEEIGERVGPFDATLLPIGAYEPRWFMKPSHMNPEEAVRAFQDLGGRGALVGMHWGTFRLTDEDPLEPPVRTREAWKAADLPEGSLWIPRHGETRVLRGGRGAAPAHQEKTSSTLE